MPEAAPFTPEIVGWRSIRSSRGLQQPGRDDGQPLAFSLEETEEGSPFTLAETDEGTPFTLNDTEEGRIGLIEQAVNSFGQRVAGAGITAAELLASGGPEPLTSDQMDRDLQMAQERRQMAQGWREYANTELYPLPEPKRVSEYVARIGGGLAFDLPTIGIGAGATGSLAAGFGLSTLASTGDPVAAAESAAMGQALKYLHALPLPTGTKLLVESGGMYSYTYARTGDRIEAAINGLLPVALHGKDLLAPRREAMRAELKAVENDPQKTAEVINKFAEEAPTVDRVNRLTPEAAAKFVAEDEMAARAFADLEQTPSRSEFKKAGFDGPLSQADRDAFRRMVQQEVARRDAAAQEPAQAATEQRTQQAVDQLNAEEAPPAPDAAEVARINQIAQEPEAKVTDLAKPQSERPTGEGEQNRPTWEEERRQYPNPFDREKAAERRRLEDLQKGIKSGWPEKHRKAFERRVWALSSAGKTIPEIYTEVAPDSPLSGNDTRLLIEWVSKRQRARAEEIDEIGRQGVEQSKKDRDNRIRKRVERMSQYANEGEFLDDFIGWANSWPFDVAETVAGLPERLQQVLLDKNKIELFAHTRNEVRRGVEMSKTRPEAKGPYSPVDDGRPVQKQLDDAFAAEQAATDAADASTLSMPDLRDRAKRLGVQTTSDRNELISRIKRAESELAARPAETSTPGNLEASNEKEVQTQGRPEGLLTGTTEGTTSPAPAPNTAQATSDMTWTELKARAKELGVPVRGNRSAVAEAVAKAESSKKLGKVIWAQEPTRRELAGQGSTIGANKPQAQEQAQAKMDLSGFGASAEPKQLKNIENALSRNVTNRGRVISRKSLVEEKIGSGATVVQSPKGLRRLMSQDGSFLDESQISKTAMDYAEHLLSTKPTFSKPQSTPSDVRPGEAYQRELRRLKLSDPPANTRQRNRLNAELKVNKTLDDLRKAYLAARSSEGRAMKAEARQEAQDAPLTLETAIYKPVHELPADAAESIQFRAKQILADNPAERTRKALEKIVKDKGSDVGGDVEAQKQRIIDELMGNKEIYPGIRVPDPDPAIERIAEGTDFAFGANMVPTAEKTTNLFGERTYEQLTGEQRGFEFGSNLAGEQPTPQGWKTQKGTIRAETDAVADAAMAAENAQSGQGTFSEAEAAQRRVDRGKDALGIVAGGGKRRADAIPGAIQVPDPAVEARLQAARGMTKKSLAQKIAEAAKTIPGKFRAQEFLPNTPENASANEFFRLIKNTPTAAVDETVRTIGAIMDTLGNTNQQILFERKLHIQNQLAALDRGEPLRHGWKDRAQVEQYNQQLDSLIAQSPEVQQAIQTRTKVVQELANNLAAEGLISKQAAARAEQYFHQQVLMKAELDRVTRGGSTARPVMRSFQKNRVKGEDLPVLGAEYDYNTRYIEAEAEWMIHAQMELRKAQLFKQFIEPRNQMGVFTERAKATGEDVAKIARAAGYDLWQPRPGNVFYRATSIPEQIAELIHQRILTEADITEDMLRTVLAIGGKKKTLALPKQIVQQLEASVKPKPDTGAAWLASEAMKTWKAYILTNPKNALGYNLRNATGDLDPVLGGAPGALKKVPAAADELRKYFIRQDASLSPTLRKARDLGVLDASYSATEIPDLRDVAILKRFYAAESGPKTVPGKLFDAYYGTLQKYTKFREGILRYASFLHYRERLANGTLKHYGASTKSVIDALVREQGVDVAAAKLSRELLGDYGNRTVFGNYMRAKVAPFYSWMEVNMTRWPRMAMNAVEYGRLQSGTRAGKIAFGALAGLALGSMTAAMYTYNRLMHPEAENELSAVDRNSPHLTLGKADDGTIILLRNTGALGDFLEWFGINSLANLLPKYMNNQVTVGEIVTEMAKSPVNKMVKGVRPDAKAAVETITGKSLYPDAFNPRTTDRGDTLAGLLNLKDEYRQAKGFVTGDGSRARPNYLQRLIGASEPKVNALQEIYDLRDAYLRQQGKPVVDRGGGAATLFTNMRRAAEAEDPKAFADAKAAYLASGKKIDNFKKSLAQLDPIAARLTDVDERRFQFRFLNNEQRAKLKTARAYAAELRKRMAKYWAQSRQSP